MKGSSINNEVKDMINKEIKEVFIHMIQKEKSHLYELIYFFCGKKLKSHFKRIRNLPSRSFSPLAWQ